MPDENFILRTLSSGVIDRLKPFLRLQSFLAGQSLYSSSEKVTNIYFPRSGAISLVSELVSGERIECALIGRDSVLGAGAALDDREAVYAAIIQIEGSGYALEVDAARRLARESEEFRTALIRHEQLILAQSQQSAACNAVHHLEQRLARWLLRVRDVTGTMSFNLTQEFMSDMLGVRRTSVTMIAQGLQEAGIIRYRRGQITILQSEKLQQRACECYVTVKARYDRLMGLAPAEKLSAGEPDHRSFDQRRS